MEYNFKEIEAKWQSRWRADKTYKVETDPSRPKFYVLDMFPYPSGAGPGNRLVAVGIELRIVNMRMGIDQLQRHRCIAII